MKYKPDRKYTVRGQIVSSTTKAPLAGFDVDVADKDILEDDFLGTATTDERGTFEVAFLEKDFRSGLTAALERGPDICLFVATPQGRERPFVVGALEGYARSSEPDSTFVKQIFETGVIPQDEEQTEIDLGTISLPTTESPSG